MNVSNQCAAKGCPNTRDGGVFIGDFCKPCDLTLRAGHHFKARVALASLYQVIGVLADHAGVFDSPDVQRALDIGSRWEELSLETIEDLIPWPKSKLKYSNIPSRVFDLTSELSSYFDSGIVSYQTDLYLLLREIESMRP